MPNGTPMPVPVMQFTDGNGNPYAGGKVTFYQGGTSTLLDTFSDLALTVPLPNPVTLNAAGRPMTAGGATTPVYWSPTIYRVKVQDAALVLVYDVDNIPSQGASSGVIDIAGTPGPIGGYAANTPVYLSDGSGGNTAGQWWATDADFHYASRQLMVGFVVSNVPTFIVRLAGPMSGFVGLTAGARYYLSTAAGAITNVPPVRRRLVGQADASGTTLIIQPTLLDPDYVTVAFNAANFTATGGGTWTVGVGDPLTFKYYTGGSRKCHLMFSVDTTDVAGAVTALNITLPAGLVATAKCGGLCSVYDNSLTVAALATWQIAAGTSTIVIQLASSAAFAASAAQTFVRLDAEFEVD